MSKTGGPYARKHLVKFPHKSPLKEKSAAIETPSARAPASIRHDVQEYKYIQISIFDGCGHTGKVVEETLGQKPTVMTAESEPYLRTCRQ